MRQHEKPLSLNQIADKIKKLETSDGLNDKCKREHLGVNPYGYGQQLNRFVCFDNEAHVRKIVMTWFEKNLKTMSLERAVCGYANGFKAKVPCAYWQKFQTL